MFRIAALLTISAACAAAHPLKLTSISVDIDQSRTLVTVVAHASMLAGKDADAAIRARLRLQLDGQPFRPAVADTGYDIAADTVTWTAQEPRRAASVVLEAPLYPEDSSETTVISVHRDGKMVDKAALASDTSNVVLGETSGAAIRRFVAMGVHHIFSGADHILFVIGLLLAGGTLRSIVGLVTAFTAAHSITLTMTALQLGSLPPSIVEPAIALSIIAVGAENLARRRTTAEVRMWLAFFFGLFHGFGFAGALLETRLPADAVAWSLAAFNIGVEIGQACIVLCVLPLLHFSDARIRPQLRLGALRFASAGIAVAGVFWFVERVASGS